MPRETPDIAAAPPPTTGDRTRPGSPAEPVVDLKDPRLFINRELSWIAFNERVLAEAEDRALPVFERLKFLGIVSTNLDEFFMVRVAGLKQQLLSGIAETPADGMLPGDQLVAISERVHAMVDRQYRIWREQLIPALAFHKIAISSAVELAAEQKAAAREYFASSVFPALTPLAVDPGHPFPHLRNKSLNLAVLLGKQVRRGRRSRADLLAVVQVPQVLPRLVPASPPAPTGERIFVLLESLIAAHIGELFPGYAVKHTALFRVTRNWDLSIDEDESEDLLLSLKEELRRRDRGAAVRLQLDAETPAELETALVQALHLSPPDVYRVAGPLQLGDLGALADGDPRPELRCEPLQPVVPTALDDTPILPVIAKRDVLLHHPYESFEPVVRFLAEAAEDPDVLAIKQTLYRTSGDSPFVRVLSRAADNGKQVTAMVEIKARFDEANNIAWARRLEDNGVHVVYGMVGLKTHCKVALVVRREGDRIRRYVHLGTGNYNPQTARQYTDLSLFTARPEIGEDVSALFNMLTGFADPPRWRRLAVAPIGLLDRIQELIDREAQRAASGQPGRILAKMNSLVDPTIIRALYAASQAGVEIDLVVRGICCLRPGVPGVSDRIRVRSVVDRYLEHSRLFVFGTGDQADVFASSADWMPRNFLRRIEVMFPVEDPALRTRVIDEILGAALRDNQKARHLRADGSYEAATTDAPALRSQAVLLEAARRLEPRLPDPSRRHPSAAPEGPLEIKLTGRVG